MGSDQVSERLAKLSRDVLIDSFRGVQRDMSKSESKTTTKSEPEPEPAAPEGAQLDGNVEDVENLRDAGYEHRARPAEDPDADTTCEGSGLEVGVVPAEQRNPFPCPVCGKNFDLGALDEKAEADTVPDHDDIRLVPEEPDDWRPEPTDGG